MKKFAIQAIALMVVIGLAIAIYTSRLNVDNVPLIPRVSKTSTVIIQNARVKVEVADTQDKRSKGLGGRESLATDSGMLFIFPKADRYPFWMKGLSFPLDFIWIRDDRVVDILQKVPPPKENQPDKDLPIYAPKVPVDKVLEVNAGVVEHFNIQVGNPIKIVSEGQ